MKKILFLLFISTVLCCDADPKNKVVEKAHLGTIEAHVTGSEEAVRSFEEGMLLLHSFEYEDARVHFQVAQELDSTMVMAYWGEAMTYNHPLWSAQYYDDAVSALSNLDSNSENRIAMAQTEIEKELMQGVEILFGSGEKAQRDSLYCVHMKNMHERFPESHEIASLYALSLLGSVPARDEAVYGKAARIVEGIINENPKHPGALHYLIHSYDDPDHAHLAKAAADEYSRVAPDAGHALHMPSHIYIALGQWEDVITSNIASYEASLKRMNSKGLDHNARNLHALHWLMYAYLQKEAYEEADSILADMRSFHEDQPSNRIKAYMTSMQATYFVERNSWPQEQLTTVDIEGLNISLVATEWFARGMSAYQSKDMDGLDQAISELSKARGDAENDLIRSGAKMCSGVSWVTQAATNEDVQRAHTMELQLKAKLYELNGDKEKEELMLMEAVKVEEATPFTFGPPVVVKPSHELFAEYLMREGREQEAREVYQKSLERAPGRRLSSI